MWLCVIKFIYSINSFGYVKHFIVFSWKKRVCTDKSRETHTKLKHLQNWAFSTLSKSKTVLWQLLQALSGEVQPSKRWRSSSLTGIDWRCTNCIPGKSLGCGVPVPDLQHIKQCEVQFAHTVRINSRDCWMIKWEHGWQIPGILQALKYTGSLFFPHSLGHPFLISSLILWLYQGVVFGRTSRLYTRPLMWKFFYKYYCTWSSNTYFRRNRPIWKLRDERNSNN